MHIIDKCSNWLQKDKSFKKIQIVKSSNSTNWSPWSVHRCLALITPQYFSVPRCISWCIQSVTYDTPLPPLGCWSVGGCTAPRCVGGCCIVVGWIVGGCTAPRCIGGCCTIVVGWIVGGCTASIVGYTVGWPVGRWYPWLIWLIDGHFTCSTTMTTVTCLHVHIHSS